jgi:hypothetical protein
MVSQFRVLTPLHLVILPLVLGRLQLLPAKRQATSARLIAVLLAVESEPATWRRLLGTVLKIGGSWSSLETGLQH